MQTTLRLWRVLHAPTRAHYRFLWQARTHTRPNVRKRGRLVWLAVAALAVLAVFFAPDVSEAITTLLVFGVGAPLLAVVFNGTLLSMYWAQAAYRVIVPLCRVGVRDVLAVTPPTFGEQAMLALRARVGWGNGFYGLASVVRVVAFMMVAVAGFSAVMIALNLLLGGRAASNDSAFADALRVLLPLMGLGVLVWLDHVQSVLAGLLTGAALAKYADGGVIHPIFASVLCLSTQGVAYVCVLLVLVVAQAFVPEDAWAMLWSVSLSAVYALIREAQLRTLWRLLEDVAL